MSITKVYIIKKGKIVEVSGKISKDKKRVYVENLKENEIFSTTFFDEDKEKIKTRYIKKLYSDLIKREEQLVRYVKKYGKHLLVSGGKDL